MNRDELKVVAEKILAVAKAVDHGRDPEFEPPDLFRSAQSFLFPRDEDFWFELLGLLIALRKVRIHDADWNAPLKGQIAIVEKLVAKP